MKTFSSIVAVILLFLKLYFNKHEDSASVQAEILKEAIDASKEVDPKLRASKLGIVINKLHNK